ncbi:MAG TPA: AraC family transcriptional regulator [Steroidobacteraceae bacterium]|jgi:AraC-like DNA-binding protein|nr:AraC family transcriptional regulator [Steroidobacteraceae bacterium]
MSTAVRIAHGSFGRVALLDMDASLVRHAHPHCHVLLKVEGADTQFLIGDTVVPLNDTSVVMVDGWQPHAYVHNPSRPRTLILALYVEPQWLKAFRPAWAASGSPGFFAQPCGEISPRIRQLARDLAADMMTRPDCRDEHETLLSDLMIAVIERFTPWRSFSSSLRAMNTSPRPDWRIRRVAETMRTDVSRNVDVSDLAKEAGLSRAHFFRLFESSIGVPPRVYLNVVRLERAVKAVVNDNANVAEIGNRLGFDVPAHFTRFFRNHTGVSPREFRAVSRLAY